LRKKIRQRFEIAITVTLYGNRLIHARESIGAFNQTQENSPATGNSNPKPSTPSENLEKPLPRLAATRSGARFQTFIDVRIQTTAKIPAAPFPSFDIPAGFNSLNE
jgi:hypothetical protein